MARQPPPARGRRANAGRGDFCAACNSRREAHPSAVHQRLLRLEDRRGLCRIGPRGSPGCRLSSSTGGEAVFPWWMCQPCSGAAEGRCGILEIVVFVGQPDRFGGERSGRELRRRLRRTRRVHGGGRKPFTDLTGQVLDAIWEVREGKPTVLRVTDLYSPVVASDWKDRHGEACMTAFETMSDAVRTAAEAHGATFDSALDVVKRSRPPPRSCCRRADRCGWHADRGEAGGQAMAAALAATGFDPTPAP